MNRILCFLFAALTVAAADSSPVELPVRAGSFDTDLSEAVVIAPADEASQQQARRIAERLQVPVIDAAAAVSRRGEFVLPAYRAKPQIVIGNINNNEAMIPLYARFLSYADADYPGRGGYVLRTIRNPFAFAPVNVIALEASDAEGLQKAVDAFLASPQLQGKECRFLFDPHPVLPDYAGQAIAKLKQTLPKFIRDGAADSTGNTISQYAVAWYLTGDPAFVPALQAYAANMGDGKSSFPPEHYYWENTLRALELITNGNLLDAASIARIDASLYRSLVQLRNDFGIRRNRERPGSRHQFSPTYSYMMLCDMLLRNLGQKTPETDRQFLTNEFNATAAHFCYVAETSYCGNGDSSSTASNMTSIFQALLALGDVTIFNNNLAREGIHRMIATVDNRGHGCGAGIYEDSYQEGNTKLQYSNGGPVYYGAFFYRDGKLKWLLQNHPGLTWNAWFTSRTWFGLHKYATGSNLATINPGEEFLNVAAISAPGSWLDYQEIQGFPALGLFDKATLRSGFGANDAYICFQGNGSGKEGLPDDKSDTLTLLRYTDHGVLWLASNSQLTGGVWRNSFMVSDTTSDSKAPGWVARLDFLGKISGGSSFAASVPEVRHGLWTRRAVRLDNGLLLIADTFTAGKSGEYAFLQTFKTPVPAAIAADGNHVVAAEAGYRMTVAGSAGTKLSMDYGMRRMEPQDFWYFRRSMTRTLAAGESVTLGSLFAVHPVTQPQEYPVLIELSPNRFVAGIGGDFREIILEDRKILSNPIAPPVPVAETQKTPEPAAGIRVASKAELPADALPEPVRGWRVIAPELAEAHELTDNAVKRWDPGAGYDGKTPLLIDLGQATDIGGLRFYTTTRKLEKAIPPLPSLALKLEGSLNAEFTAPVSREVKAEYAPETRDLYKLISWRLDAFSGKTKLPGVRFLRISGLPSRIVELELYSERHVPARIEQLESLPDGGVAVRTSAREIYGFDRNGKPEFTIALADNPISFLADPVLGVLVISEDHTLRRFDYSGKQLNETVLFQRPCTLAVLKNRDGSRKIAVCYYDHVQFLSPKLSPLTPPKQFFALWTETAKAVDLNRDGNDDLVMHDIYGRGYQVDGTSGAISSMFQMVPGITANIEAIGGTPERYVVLGQNQLCMFNADGSCRWRHDDGSQYAGTALWNGAVYMARAVGHVVKFNVDTGTPEGYITPGGRIFTIGVAANRLWVATNHGLYGYTQSGQVENFYPGTITQLIATPDAIWAVAAGQLLRLEPVQQIKAKHGEI